MVEQSSVYPPETVALASNWMALLAIGSCCFLIDEIRPSQKWVGLYLKLMDDPANVHARWVDSGGPHSTDAKWSKNLEAVVQICLNESRTLSDVYIEFSSGKLDGSLPKFNF